MLIGLLRRKFESPQYLPLIWKLAGNKSKPLKELVAQIVAEKDPGAEEKAIGLLEHKNSETRQTAAGFPQRPQAAAPGLIPLDHYPRPPAA